MGPIFLELLAAIDVMLSKLDKLPLPSLILLKESRHFSDLCERPLVETCAAFAEEVVPVLLPFAIL
jgi:hypothetical protein